MTTAQSDQEARAAEAKRLLRERKDVWRSFRDELRGARAEVLRDGEAGEQLVYAIERLGRFLKGWEAPLGKAQTQLADLVQDALGKERAKRFRRSLLILVETRNDRMHKGQAARNLARDAMRVASVLEVALANKWNSLLAEDVMTESPVCAHEWHTLTQIRDLMVTNAFTHLPVRVDDRWEVISDAALVKEMLRQRQRNEKNPGLQRLSEKVPGEERTYLRALSEPVQRALPTDKALELDFVDGVILVVRKEGDLVGIIGPSDVV